MKKLLALAALTFALIASGHASAGVDNKLSSLVDVEVRCLATWDMPGALGYYWLGSVYLPNKTCRVLRSDMAGNEATSQNAIWLHGEAWLTLAHEFAHAYGATHVRGPNHAECMAEKADFRLMRLAGLSWKYAKELDWGWNITKECGR